MRNESVLRGSADGLLGRRSIVLLLLLLFVLRHLLLLVLFLIFLALRGNSLRLTFYATFAVF